MTAVAVDFKEQDQSNPIVNDHVSTSTRAKTGLIAIASYIWLKCKETTGFELTRVQSVYWRAVQRRMVLGQLEEIIDQNLKIIHARNITVPYELAASLVRCDQAIEKYLLAYLDERDIMIGLPREVELEDVDHVSPTRLIVGTEEPDTGPTSIPKQFSVDGKTSIHPNTLVKIMKQNQVTMENEEEYLEHKGGFLKQGWLALKLLKEKCKEKMNEKNSVVESGSEETDGALIGGMEGIDDLSSSDDDYDLLLDKMYDHERPASPDDGTMLLKKPSEENDVSYYERKMFRVGGRSLRPSWTVITEHIPFVVSSFRYKHIVKTNYKYTGTERDIDEQKKRNHEITRERHAKLKNLWNKAARWPLFTYWLMFVQTFILILTLSVHGFAPFGYVPFTEVALVQQSDLSVDIVEKQVVPNIWAGPPQDSLVLLGANYGPCMRRDRLLYDAIDQDREYEANQSGCCVRRDGSGCVQVASENDCPNRNRLTDFIFYDSLVDTTLYTNRSVCGTSPRTCLSPPTSSSSWQVASISDWPICQDSDSPPPNINKTDQHLSCDVTGRPCCVGIQAVCMITTRENCEFLEGNFQQDAFLCSQVDCLKTICGLTPFAKQDRPDQIQRLGLALFLHAGIFHLILTLIFDFIILRNLEKYLGWLSTSILYIGSGIGGNTISGVFVPYSPEVGPAASIFGVISFFLVFIFFHWEMLHRPLLEMMKYFGILFVLIVVGLLPYIDNYARLGGLLFGLLFSFIHVHYIPPWEAIEQFERFKSQIENNRIERATTTGCFKRLVPKIVLFFTGLVLVILLFIFSFSLFIEYQSTWDGFTYLNCIIPTSVSELCRDFGQNVRPRISTAV